MAKTKGKDTSLQEAPVSQEDAQTVQEAPSVAAESPEEGQDVQEVPAPPEAAEEPSVAENAVLTVNYPDGLNLRDGPGKGFGVLGVLPHGAVLTVLELPGGAEVPGHALVRYGGLVGWIDTGFVREG